jgi:hypothetical protein
MDAVAGLFLRALGVTFACAFVSLWVQIEGLIGARGIAPAAELLSYAHEQLGARAYLALPTLLWITGASDAALHALCALGVAASLALAVGRVRRSAVFVAWLAYLSLSSVGDVFLQFQWDALLLETGAVALFVAAARSPVGTWLARLTLAKLMLLSGAVKLLSGDSSWRDGSALTYHFWTQPLPAFTSLWADALPAAAQRFNTFATLAIELGAPLALFLPRPARLTGCAVLAALQLLIAATGNYGFFNLLTLVLCLAALDDRALPPRAREWLSCRPLALPGAWPRRALLAGGVAFGTLQAAAGLQRVAPVWVTPLRPLLGALAPLRSLNSYGLFAVMTKRRPEILLEGSADGRDWRSYSFRWKPDALERRPRFATPHMPRLDWQLWFAALGHCEDEAWFQSFLLRLLEGSQPVAGLLATDPFPDAPPRYLRATVADYRFASLEARQRGLFWQAGASEPYCPVVELRAGHLAVADLPD